MALCASRGLVGRETVGAHAEGTNPESWLGEDGLCLGARLVSFERAAFRDGEALAEISRRAFDADVRSGAPPGGGPPGYDSDKWQMRMMFAGKYFKVMYGDQLAGGFVVFDRGDGRLELGRIFIDPAYQGRGIGTRIMRHLGLLLPGGQTWSLATPVWNRRTHRFYEGMGFRRVGRKAVPDGPILLLYEKRVR